MAKKTEIIKTKVEAVWMPLVGKKLAKIDISVHENGKTVEGRAFGQKDDNGEQPFFSFLFDGNTLDVGTGVCFKDEGDEEYDPPTDEPKKANRLSAADIVNHIVCHPDAPVR